MTKRCLIAGLLIFAFCLFTSSVPAFAQAVYGSILGTVTDPQGAAVSGATVTVTNQRKGTSDTATTNESGNYSVTHLIPDVYTVRIEAPGFKAAEQKEVNVLADAGSRVDMQVQLGGTSETVEVTAEAPQLKTDRADVATTFNEKYVEDVPILNRNFTTLQLLSPGSQKMVGWSHAATENPQGSQQIFTQGQHFSGTAFELDGTDNQDPILGIIVVNPNLDAVTEAKVALQNYDAEFGKAVSSVVTAQTKSGSNELHGSGFWFWRSDGLYARDPFTQYPGSNTDSTGKVLHPIIPKSKWEQFGGTIGGPIIKDKLFFFGDYQGTRQTTGVSGIFTVPTALVRSTCNPATNTTGFCDLSEYLSSAAGVSGGGQVYNPTTGNTLTGANRSPFPNNQIPIGMISPAAAKILEAFPAPENGNPVNNFSGSGSGPYDQNSFDTRIDYDASPTVNVFGRFSLDYFSLSGTSLLGAVGGPGNGLLGLAGSSITHNYSLSSGVTKTFSSTLLLDFRFGYFKYNPQTQKPDGGTPMTNFGIPNANTSDPKTAGLGAFLLGPDPISGQGCTDNNGNQGCVVSSFGDGLGVARCNCPLTESEQQFQWVANLTKIHGNHQFKFGGDVRYAMNLRIPSDNNRTGEYNFSPQVTSNGGAGGLDLATFLLGDVSKLARYVNNPNLASANNAAERQWRTFFYGQDTWRATSKLTVNYGLRWEIYFPEYVNAKGNGGFANIVDLGGTGAIRVGGYGPFGLNGNVQNDFHAFAPRIGIAYQVNPKTVVRAGYGRSYDIGVFGSNFGHTVTQNLPVLLKQNIDATAVIPGASANLVPVFSLDNGPIAPAFPAIPTNGLLPFCSPDPVTGNCVAGSLGAAQVPGTHIRPIRQTLPAVDAWNVSLQDQLTNTLSITASYVGSKGTHGFAGDGPNYDVNPVSMYLYHVVDPNSTTTPQAFYSQNARRPLCGLNFSTSQCTKIPFDLGNYYGNDAASTYNAFEVLAEKRFSNGLQFLTHYTFSHTFGYDSNYYAINHGIAWGAVDFARNQVWVANIVYELPFGKGKSFMGDASKAMNYLVGGWQLSNTTNWSSGLPWTPSFSGCGKEEDVNVCRPNVGGGSFKTGVGSLHTGAFGTQPYIQYFTPVPTITATTSGPFLDPGVGNLGNFPRNGLHGPSGFYSDLSVAKKFFVTERFNMTFRTDFYNLFNHPVYAFSQNNGANNACIDCGGATNPGQIRGLEYGTNMRQIQFALRFDF